MFLPSLPDCLALLRGPQLPAVQAQDLSSRASDWLHAVTESILRDGQGMRQ